MSPHPAGLPLDPRQQDPSFRWSSGWTPCVMGPSWRARGWGGQGAGAGPRGQQARGSGLWWRASQPTRPFPGPGWGLQSCPPGDLASHQRLQTPGPPGDPPWSMCGVLTSPAPVESSPPTGLWSSLMLLFVSPTLAGLCSEDADSRLAQMLLTQQTPASDGQGAEPSSAGVQAPAARAGIALLHKAHEVAL